MDEHWFLKDWAWDLIVFFVIYFLAFYLDDFVPMLLASIFPTRLLTSFVDSGFILKLYKRSYKKILDFNQS